MFVFQTFSVETFIKYLKVQRFKKVDVRNILNTNILRDLLCSSEDNIEIELCNMLAVVTQSLEWHVLNTQI